MYLCSFFLLCVLCFRRCIPNIPIHICSVADSLTNKKLPNVIFLKEKAYKKALSTKQTRLKADLRAEMRTRALSAHLILIMPVNNTRVF